MKTKYFLIIILSLSITKFIFCQVNQAWLAIYDGPAGIYDEGHSLAVDTSGNVYVACRAGFGNSGKFSILKYNQLGTLEWSLLQGIESSYAQANDIVIDNSGFIYATGTAGINQNFLDILTIKFNSSGSVIWSRNYHLANDDDLAYKMKMDKQNNVYIIGGCYDSSNIFNIVTIKYDQNGNLLWSGKSVFQGGHPEFLGIGVFNDSNIYVTGGSYPNSKLIKYNSAGQEIWSKLFLGRSKALAVDSNENIIVAGHYNKFLVRKFNKDGDSIWYSLLGGASGEAHDVLINKENNACVTGNSGGEYLTVKLDPSGELIWNGVSNTGDPFSISRSIAKDTSDNIYVTGELWSTFSRYGTFKYNRSGSRVWSQYFNLINSCYANKVVADNKGNVYVTGRVLIGNGGFNVGTIKYSQIVDVNEISNEFIYSYQLLQNYPNPFNPITKITFYLLHSANVNLIVYDMLGIEVKSIVKGDLSMGRHEFDFDGSNFASGVYYYKLFSDNFNETKKMILLK